MYSGVSTVSCAGNTAITGVRSYTVSERGPVMIDPSDDDVFGMGAEKGKASVSGSLVTDDPLHGCALHETGSGAFTEKQGATTKVHSISNQIITGVERTASDRGGRGSSTVSWEAYSSDGSTSPVTKPT
jgi:hypothetical protein